jgi:hypothetical protein
MRKFIAYLSVLGGLSTACVGGQVRQANNGRVIETQGNPSERKTSSGVFDGYRVIPCDDESCVMVAGDGANRAVGPDSTSDDFQKYRADLLSRFPKSVDVASSSLTKACGVNSPKDRMATLIHLVNPSYSPSKLWEPR